MKRLKMVFASASIAIIGLLMMSADHIDAPSVAGSTSDIADFYAFASKENSQNMIFAVTLQGLLSPNTTSAASFDENVLVEINIDNNGDNVEDKVIQLIPRDGKMYAFGPFDATSSDLTSTINSGLTPMEVDITPYSGTAIIGSQGTSKLFAGPRDDPFFFDLGAYTSILAGTAGGFSDPGTDTFAGTNVLAIVVEVPKSSLGSGSTINTWTETKIKQ